MREALRPVWVAFPTIAWGSIGWRMGPGEDYWRAWVRWFECLTQAERDAYKADWPEPEGWQDFYAFIETGAMPGWILERRSLIETAAVPPRPDEDVIRDYHRVLWLLRQHFKRVSRDDPGKDECLAEIYAAPDGTRWRLSAHATRGGLHFTRLPAGQ